MHVYSLIMKGNVESMMALVAFEPSPSLHWETQYVIASC